MKRVLLWAVLATGLLGPLLAVLAEMLSTDAALATMFNNPFPAIGAGILAAWMWVTALSSMQERNRKSSLTRPATVPDARDR